MWYKNQGELNKLRRVYVSVLFKIICPTAWPKLNIETCIRAFKVHIHPYTVAATVHVGSDSIFICLFIDQFFLPRSACAVAHSIQFSRCSSHVWLDFFYYCAVRNKVVRKRDHTLIQYRKKSLVQFNFIFRWSDFENPLKYQTDKCARNKKKIYFRTSDNNIWTRIRLQYHFWHILKIFCWVFCVKALLLVNKKSHNLYELKRLATQPSTIHDSTHFERERIFGHRINYYFPFRDMKLEKSKFNQEFKPFWTKTHTHRNHKKVGQSIYSVAFYRPLSRYCLIEDR